MAAKSLETSFIVWGVDQTAYGPVELSTLESWVKDRRVTPESWVFALHSGAWLKAGEMEELRLCFPGTAMGMAAEAASRLSPRGPEPGVLRRVKILAGMKDEHLERFAQFAEAQRVLAETVIVSQSDRDDSLYLLLEGEVRVRLVVLGQEVRLATLGAGEVFGDLALLDHGPRSADVVANTDCLLARVSSAAFEELAKGELDVSTPLLRAIDQTLTERIRADNQRYSEAVKSAHARAARGQ